MIEALPLEVGLFLFFIMLYTIIVVFYESVGDFMRIQRKTMLWSFIIALLMFSLATLIEWRIINNNYNITFLVGHREYVVNCLIGIAASALVAFAVSFVSYISEKRKVLYEYLKITPDVFIISGFFVKLVIDYVKNGKLTIPQEEVNSFGDELKRMRDIFRDVSIIGMSYSPILFYENKFGVLKKRQKEKLWLNYCQYNFHILCTDIYWESELVFEYSKLLTLKKITQQERDFLLQEQEKSFNKLISMIDGNSNLDLSRKQLETAIRKYMKIK